MFGLKKLTLKIKVIIVSVIIIIVSVFDPLAIVLILAATYSIDWARSDKEKRKKEKLATDLIERENHLTQLKAEEALLEKQKENALAELSAVQQEISPEEFIADERDEQDYSTLEEELKHRVEIIDEEDKAKEYLERAVDELTHEMAALIQEQHDAERESRERDGKRDKSNRAFWLTRYEKQDQRAEEW